MTRPTSEPLASFEVADQEQVDQLFADEGFCESFQACMQVLGTVLLVRPIAGEAGETLAALRAMDLQQDWPFGADEERARAAELLRDGAFIAETETDQYGFYRFEDLYPAVYTLRVTAPDEVKATGRRTDIRLIASVLEEDGDGNVYESAEIQVESDKANYNADIGFVCLKEGVVPPGTGEGKKQVWTGYKEGD